jgi:hypothetical protein
VLGRRGKYNEAETMHRRVPELKRRVLGKEHPSALTSMDHLGAMLDNQGRYNEAEAMHRQELRIGETLTSMGNLVVVLSSPGQLRRGRGDAPTSVPQLLGQILKTA